jgi:hypothetical protein
MEGQNNNSPFRIRWMKTLEEVGFPKELRKVSLVNGTTLSTKVGGVEGETFLALRGRQTIFGINGIPITIRAIGTSARFMETSFRENELFSGFLRLGINNTLRESLYRTNINPHGSMDIVQGGTYNTAKVIKDEFTETLNGSYGVSFHKWTAYIPTHSFIPTVSSLAFYNPNFNWNDNINRNLICTGEIPFDSYFAPPVNEEHVNVTATSVEWLLEEIEGNPQAPHYPFDENGFLFSSSSSPVCIGNTATLEVKECMFPSEIKWNVSSNLQITIVILLK